MTAIETSVDLAGRPRINNRQALLVGGRVALATLLLLAWHYAAVRFGSLYFAPPLDVLDRLAADFGSGALAWHTYITLRLSAIGFALGCGAGVLLPLILRGMPRLTAAIEPYIMASVGVPKYALIPLFILWFGIDDAPKLWLVGLLVFYVIFIAVFSGIRSVDQRLVNMARVVGARELAVSREVVFNSLLPFFFTALKIALPRAVSAAIIGEFLVGNEGLGYYIEDARQMLDTTGVFTGIIVSIALVLIINGLLVLVDRSVNAWRPVERHMQI